MLELEVSGVVAPEFVSHKWEEAGSTPTVFYPDVSLWLGEVEISEGHEMGGKWIEAPLPYSPYHAERVTAPASAFFDERFNRIFLEEASTRRWARPLSSDV